MPLPAFVSQTLSRLNALLERDFSEKEMRYILGGLVVLLASFLYLRDIDKPTKAFWDESYYVTAAERYVRGEAQYASHPPLAFMFMKLGIVITNSNADLDTHALAEVKKLDDTTKLTEGYNFTGIRLMACLFSVVSCFLFYLIILKLVTDPFEAFVFTLLYLFENAFIVHFRAAHLDPYQMTFALGAVAVWVYGFGKDLKRPLVYYGLIGLLCGLSFMVKVNSLVLLALGGFSLLRALWGQKNREGLKAFIMNGASLGAAFAATVMMIFALHTAINPVPPNPSAKAGKNYLTYMGTPYKDFLNDKRPLSPTVIWDATRGYYDYMHHDFTGITKTEKNGSDPALWPFMNRIISYRWDFNGRKTAYVQMIGNPINWALAIVGTLGALVLILRRRSGLQADLECEDMNRLEALSLMYLVYWVVHIYLGTQRVMYIYHYFIGLTLAFMMTALAFKILADRWVWLKKNRLYVQLALSAAIAASFVFYAPLTYHVPLSRSECEARNIFFKAVICQPMK